MAKATTERRLDHLAVSGMLSRVSRLPVLAEHPVAEFLVDPSVADGVTIGSNKLVAWRCQGCGVVSEKPVKVVVYLGRVPCLPCSTIEAAQNLRARAVTNGTSFAEKFPEHAAEWHEDNDRGPGDVSSYSHYSATWRCGVCGNVWESEVRRKVCGFASCDVCPRGGHLSVVDSEFAKFLDNERNDLGAIRRFPLGSHEVVWWVCDCGSSFQKGVSKYIGDGRRSCTGCTRRGKLVDERPDIAAEWDPSNSKDVTTIALYSNVRALWRCADCGFQWEAIVANRTSKGSGCPDCWMRSGPISKTEHRIGAKLALALDEDLILNSQLDLGGYKITPDIRTHDGIVIEYDSLYWHSDRITRDGQRLRLLTKFGYRVISIREMGLRKLTKDDIVWRCSRSSEDDLVRLLVQNVLEFRDTQTVVPAEEEVA